ncbi:MAG: sn-glycerol-1-phosphate dehydrogenase [Clostridia bacterium]|nr:sn-glycerol-1-phosphate dehydrogenase [Clostridia bacterium]
MEIKESLKIFCEKPCSCGKKHVLPVSDIFIGNGAIQRITDVVAAYGAKKAAVLSDKNTFDAAGEKVCGILRNSGTEYKNVILSDGKLFPDERAVGKAAMLTGGDCDMVISVGSGVVNDIGKIISALTKTPYVIVATAPSMDGYASATSSMDIDGLKVSLPSKCPDVIIGDIDVLKNAPVRMLQAGIGDMLAKYISIAEWRISHEITGEYYCERVADLVRKALKRCVDNAAGLLKRDDEAVRSVFEGLVVSGVAMAFAGVSRPASGVEHYFSHIWDMRGLEFGTKTDLHGIQCAVATSVAAGLYEKVKLLSPDREKALKYVKAFDYDKHAEKLREFIGKGADAMIANEKTERKYDAAKHAARLEAILGKWKDIISIIEEEIPLKSQINGILGKIGAPETIEELGIEGDIYRVFGFTKDIRDKYVLSRLLWDLGETENVFRS